MKVTLFLGAGASRFVELPATKELIGKVVDRIYQQEKRSNPVKQFVRNIVKPHSKDDVEYLYSDIDKMLEGETTHQKILNHKLAEWDGGGRVDREIHFTSKNPNIIIPKISESEDVKNTINDLKELKTTIRNTLMENLLVGPDKVEDIVNVYDVLLKYTNNILTINYDNVIETYCERKRLHLVDGFEPSFLGDKRVWNRAVYGEAVYGEAVYGESKYGGPGAGKWDNKDKSIRLVKLHGSVTWWKGEDGTVLEAGVPRIGDITNDVMIAPTLGEKDYSHDIFPSIKRRFEEVLKQTDLLVVIGCSFRDPAINNMIKERLSYSNKRKNYMRMLVVNPHPEEALQNLYKERVTAHPGPYDKLGLKDYSVGKKPQLWGYEHRFGEDSVNGLEHRLLCLTGKDSKLV